MPVYKKVWFLKGQKPKGVFFWSNKKLNIFGALIDGSNLFYDFYGSLNSFTYLNFLDSFVKKLSKKKKYVFVFDNASYHKSSVVREYLESLNKNIAVEFLPSYSPELNPTETCWKIIRGRVTNSTYFPTLEIMQKEINKFLSRHFFSLNVSNYLCPWLYYANVLKRQGENPAYFLALKEAITDGSKIRIENKAMRRFEGLSGILVNDEIEFLAEK